MKLLLLLLLFSFSTLAARHADFSSSHGVQLKLHKSNYLLPLYQSPGALGARKETEVSFQFSFEVKLLSIGATYLGFAYTQKSFWQAYDAVNSMPFRENNYNPELFYRIGQKSVRWDIGLEHESNGEAEPTSRSWDRIFTRVEFLSSHLRLQLKYWYIYAEDYYSPTQPEKKHNMRYYMGSGHISLAVRMGSVIYKLLGRYNFSTHYGYQQHWLLFPLGSSLYWAFHYTKGYGNSLRDYIHSIESYGTGIVINP